MDRKESKEMAYPQGNQNRRRGNQKSQLRLKEIEVGDPKQDGLKFKVDVTVGVYVGDQPAQDAAYEFWANGKLLVSGDVDPEGKAAAELTLEGEKVPVHIVVVLRDDPRSRKFLFVKKISLPKLRKRLDVLGAFEKKNAQDEVVSLRIFLRRTGKDGKVEAGPVSAFDFARVLGQEEWQQRDWQMEAAGQSVCVELSARETARTIEFFLPDDKDAKVSVQVPGSRKLTDESGTKPYGLSDFIVEAASNFRKGQEIRKGSVGLSDALAKIKEETQ